MNSFGHYLPSCGRVVRIYDHPELTGLCGVVENATQRFITIRLNVTGEEVRVRPNQVVDITNRED